MRKSLCQGPEAGQTASQGLTSPPGIAEATAKGCQYHSLCFLFSLLFCCCDKSALAKAL